MFVTISHRWPRLLRAFAVIIGFLAIGWPTAANADSEAPLTLNGPDVVDYTVGYPSYPLVNARRILVQGTRVPLDGGCTVHLAFDLLPKQTPQTVEEIAFDPTTCQDLFEVGTMASPRPMSMDASTSLAAGNVQNLLTTTDSSGGASASATPNASGGWGTDQAVPTAPYSSNTYRVFNDGWYDDPIRWTGARPYNKFPPVNEQLNFAEWTPGGGCNQAPGVTGYVGYWQQWLSGTGWYRVSNDWTHTATTISCGDQIFSDSNSYFQNRVFCALPLGLVGALLPTDVHYEPVHVTGWGNGTATVYLTEHKSGPCGHLLRVMDTNGFY
jgi:hypothetical protein